MPFKKGTGITLPNFKLPADPEGIPIPPVFHTKSSVTIWEDTDWKGKAVKADDGMPVLWCRSSIANQNINDDTTILFESSRAFGKKGSALRRPKVIILDENLGGSFFFDQIIAGLDSDKLAKSGIIIGKRERIPVAPGGDPFTNTVFAGELLFGLAFSGTELFTIPGPTGLDNNTLSPTVDPGMFEGGDILCALYDENTGPYIYEGSDVKPNTLAVATEMLENHAEAFLACLPKIGKFRRLNYFNIFNASISPEDNATRAAGNAAMVEAIGDPAIQPDKSTTDDDALIIADIIEEILAFFHEEFA